MKDLPKRLGLGDPNQARRAYVKGTQNLLRHLRAPGTELTAQDRLFLADLVERLNWEAHERGIKDAPDVELPARQSGPKHDPLLLMVVDVLLVADFISSDVASRRALRAFAEAETGLRWGQIRHRINRWHEPLRTTARVLFGLPG